MSKAPLMEMGNISMEKLVIEPDRSEDVTPYGFGLPVYATAPDPSSNERGTLIFNSTTDAIEVVRNSGTYTALAFDGDSPSGNVTLATYDTDAEAPNTAGSIYLNTDDYAGNVRVYNSGKFSSLAPLGTPLNDFTAPSDNIYMNNFRLTGLSDGVDVTDSVTLQQLTSATISRHGAISVTTPGTPQTFVTAGTPQGMGGTFVASSTSSAGILITGNTITNTSGAALTVKISLNSSVSSFAGGSVVTVYIAKNGSMVGKGNSTFVESAGKAYSLGCSDIITLANNDAVTPFLDTDTNGDILTVESAYFNVAKA